MPDSVSENPVNGVALASRKNPFDVVLMDLQMPIMDGYTATKKIREQLSAKDLPIIAMTADAMSGVQERTGRMGMNDYVSKPIDPAVLFRVLLKWIKPGERVLPQEYAKQQKGKHKRSYLRNVNVQWNKINITNLAQMDFDRNDRKRYRLKYGDVLICEGGEVGRAAIWKDELPECYFQKALHRARPNPKLAQPEFIVLLLYSLAQLGGLIDFTSQVTIAHLTGVKLKTIEFPLPPLPLQAKFTQVVNSYERLWCQQHEALRQAEHLFQSLLARSFEDA